MSTKFRTVLLVIVLTNAWPFSSGSSPQAPEPALAAAAARLQAQDPAGATILLEELTTRQPGNLPAWRMLGVARLRSKSLDAALAAFQRVLVIDPTASTAIYNIGVVCTP